jgi:hypothetical protein
MKTYKSRLCLTGMLLGLTSLSSFAVATPDVTFLKEGSDVLVRQVMATNTPEGTQVRGKLHKRSAAGVVVNGHLDLEVRDASGQVMANYQTAYTPARLSEKYRRAADFRFQLPQQIPDDWQLSLSLHKVPLNKHSVE